MPVITNPIMGGVALAPTAGALHTAQVSGQTVKRVNADLRPSFLSAPGRGPVYHQSVLAARPGGEQVGAGAAQQAVNAGQGRNRCRRHRRNYWAEMVNQFRRVHCAS